MLRILILITMILVTYAGSVSSQVDDPKSLSTTFSKIPGTPRVAANEANKEWLVIWRQGIPGKIIGRIIKADGTPRPIKTLLTGIPSSSHSLDVAFDTLNSRYLLAFESNRGLAVQVFDKGLTKQGSAILIESGVKESYVRVVFDPARNNFLLCWLDSQESEKANILKVLRLDPSGNAMNNPKNIVQARQGNHFSALSVARDPKSGRFMLMMVEVNSKLESSVIGYMMKPDATLLTKKSALFQKFTPSLNTVPQASFANSGKGLAFWSDANQVKSRIISQNGKAGASTKTIKVAAVPMSLQPAIAFDSQNAEFVALWAEQKQIKGARLNSNTGATNERFDVAASILDNTLHVALSHNPADGNFLAVWEDAALNVLKPSSPPTKFRIRAGILGGGNEIVVSGEPRIFIPSQVTIRVGTTVKWINNTGNHPITITSGTPSNPTGLFDQALRPGQSFKYKFTQAGSYPYFCRHAPDEMIGNVTVIP